MKKNIILVFTILVCVSFLFADHTIDLNNGNTDIQLMSNRETGITVDYKIGEIRSFDINTKSGIFTQIAIEGYTYSNEIGSPKLPILRKIISVPLEAEVSLEIINSDITELNLSEYAITNSIFPAQHPVSKSVDPNTIPFEYNSKVYQINEFSSERVIQIEELGIMRGMRLFVLEFAPIKYNPVSNMLRIYNNMEVNVEFLGSNFSATDYLRKRTYSPHFEKTYAQAVFNFTESRDVITQYPVKYVIISDPMFEAQLQPFIEWKIEKGFEVIEAYTDDPNVGNSTNSIKSFLQDLYDNGTPADPAPSFVLFVGDVAQVPVWSGGTGSHITDLNYVKLDGNNIVPDMYYGRFSANNTNELQPQIDKTLEYEKFEMPDPSYLGEVVMIAGMDSSHGNTWGNGQINYGTSNYFNAAHGITSHTYLYPQSGSNSANIVQNVSDGVGYINYTAHGWDQGWADPSFTMNNINNLQNEGKYCLAVGNCCLTNKFEVLTCFGEAWLRAENKGAIGYIGGTNSTYWDEDYWWGVGAGNVTTNPTYQGTGAGVYDGLFHDNGEEFANWFTTTASMLYAGNLAVTEGGGSINYYWEIYSIMGDPSLEAYFGVPDVNTVMHPSVIFLGMDTTQISAEPYSYVSITMNGEIYGTAIIDETGSAAIEHEAFTEPGLAKLVVSRQNFEPYITEIEVIPAAGAYVVISSFETIDNNNNIPEYDETISFDITFENVGTEIAEDVNAVISTDDTYVTITQSEVAIGLINSNATVIIEDAFEIEVHDNIPDQHTINFDVAITGDETWDAVMQVTFNAPSFEAGIMVINDIGGDGILDPGESATIQIPITNIGNAISQDLIANITSASPELITIINGTHTSAGLGIAEQTIASFDIEVDENAPEGVVATLIMMVNSGGYSSAFSFFPAIGIVMEDFETGDFSSFNWEMGQFSWEITSANPYAGIYSAKSAVISNNQTASISVTMDVPSDGEISFYRRVSSEGNYDYLRFYINGTEQGEWAGTVDWSQVSYPVSSGSDTEFTWAYEKDGSVSTGEDCAWIDDIEFPAAGSGNSAIISVSTTNIEFGEVTVGDILESEFTIFNLGTVDLSGSITAPAGFSVDTQDYLVEPYANLIVTATFTPTQGIDYSGDIEITSNDPNQSEVLIAVSGTGILVGNDPELIPTITELNGNYPNPFNPSTNIKFSLKADSKVTLEIFNIRGQKVKTLVNEQLSVGFHNIIWNGKDDYNRNVSSGIYFSSFKAEDEDYTSVKKMILMK